MTANPMLTTVIRNLVRQPAVPGAVLGLCWPNGRQCVVAAGVGRGVAGSLRAEHRFLLTSLTKVLTATQIHMITARGHLDLEAPVSDYLPEFAANGKRDITTWQLLTHTSGLDSTGCNDAERADATSTPAELYTRVCAAGLSSAPGARVEYCSPAYWVLAELVHRLTGTKHSDHLADEIAAPLGLHNMSYEPAGWPERLVAPSEPRYDGLAERVRRLAYPAGGVVSTAADLLTIGRIYLDEHSDLLGGPAQAQLQTPVTNGLPGRRSPSQNRYPTERSAGWALGGPGALSHPRLLWHTGASGTSWWVDPRRRVVVVLLTASWYLPSRLLGDVLDATLRLVDGQSGTRPP